MTLRRPALLLGMLAAAFAAAGCSAVSARKVIQLDRFQHFHVERRFNENNHLDELIAAELRRHGRSASAGPRTMMPENTEVLVTYDARWTWDFQTYLIELNLEMHTVSPPKKIADARHYQPSMRPKAPTVAVGDLIGRLFTR